MSPRSQAPPPGLSVVIPLFNEEENVEILIKRLFEAISAMERRFEVVLVDDGSSDRTAEIAMRFAADDGRVRLLRHERNRGLGGAIRTGLAAATGEFVLYTDADLPFDFRLIPFLLARASEQRVVIGCRLNRGEGARRLVLTRCYNLVCRLLLGFRVRDINFACKLMPRSAVRRMRLESEGSFIDAEMLLECRRLGLEIVEHPMTYFPRERGQSTLSRPRVILGILWEMAAYRFGAKLARARRRDSLPIPADIEPAGVENGLQCYSAPTEEAAP